MWIKCKNNEEKLKAILNYCKEEIKENNQDIEFMKANRRSVLDYEYEINELIVRNSRFNDIIKVIEADENTSVLI